MTMNWSRLVGAPVFEDERKALQAKHANTVLWALFFLWVALSPPLILDSSTPTKMAYAVALAGVFLVGLIILMVLLRWLRLVMLAGWLACGLVWSIFFVAFVVLFDLFKHGYSFHFSSTFLVSAVIASFLLGRIGGIVYGILHIVGVGALFTRCYSSGVPIGVEDLAVQLGIGLMLNIVLWIATRSMDRAIHDLHALNLELEDRVDQRTGELRAILDSTADGIVVFDPSGTAAVANPAAAALLDKPAGEIVGSDIRDLVGNAVDIDASGVKLRYGDKTLSVTAAPVRLDSGEEIGTVAVFHDFTREAEVSRMKSFFLSIASHDLRSPLGAILGLTELVREGVYTSSEEQREIIDRIYSNTQYMLSLANSLLGRAQIEAGILQLRLAPFPLADLIENVIKAMAIQAQDKGIELTTRIAENLPGTIVSDQEKVSQVLFNLVGNGIKFTDAGSVQVCAHLHGDEHWALVVSDTGRGIAEDAQAVVFEPFRRGEGASAGVGLGLSIVKQLVELMGGEIQLQSQLGEGSTFTIVLPMAPEARGEAEC
jgi:signal transduction histidine kinase